jgi:hypothetical protein
LTGTLNAALEAQREGRLTRAVALYQTVLRAVPDHFDASHMLGVVKLQLRQFEDAARLIAGVLSCAPDEMRSHVHHNLALCLIELARSRGLLHALAQDPGVLSPPAPFLRAHALPEAILASPERVSVIVTDATAPASLARTLASIAAATAAIDARVDVVAVTNAYGEERAAIAGAVAGARLPVRLVDGDDVDPAAQIDAAIAEAAGDTLCMMRAGDRWAPRWLAWMSNAMRVHGTRWGFSALRIESGSGAIARFGDSAATSALLRTQDDLYRLRTASLAFLSFNPIAAGRNLIVRRALWEERFGATRSGPNALLDWAWRTAQRHEPVYLDEPAYLIPAGTEDRHLHHVDARDVVATYQGTGSSAAPNRWLRHGLSRLSASHWRLLRSPKGSTMSAGLLQVCAGTLGVGVAEGTHLGPDQQYGLGHLEATRDALQSPTFACSSATPQARAGSPSLRLVGISCVGNEADVVEAFVRHNLAFLDHLLILEHNTLDGTRDILARLAAEGLPLTVTHSSDPKFRQIAFTNELLRAALEEHGADWVFAIDCDEFLRAGSRRELEEVLTACGEAHMRLPWVNYVLSPGDDPDEPHPLRRIRHRYDYPPPDVDDNPWVWKIAANARLLGDYHLDRYEICRGNHFLSLPDEQRPISAAMLAQRTVRLAHFPIRSADQMAVKSALGVLSRLGTGARSGYYGRAWKELTSGTLGMDTLAAATRIFLDTGRYDAEALEDTPVRLDPIPVDANLRYDNCRVPALGTILKWVELNLLDDAGRRDSIWQDAR